MKYKPDKLIMAILNAKNMAAKMNRWRTFHKLDEASKTAGWELADILRGRQKIGDKK